MNSKIARSVWLAAREPSNQPRVALAMALVASVPRIWFVLFEHPPGLYIAADIAHYERCAERLRQGMVGAADSFTPVGYPALLAVLFSLSAKSYLLVSCFHVFMASATVALTHLVAFRVTRSAPLSLCASIASSFYFPIIFYAGFLLSETTFGFLVLLSVWLALRAADSPTLGARIVLGATMAAAAIVRPNFALAIPFVLLWGGVADDERARRRLAIAALAGVLALILPVCAYHSWLLGRPAGLATNGGVNFFLAHSDYTAVSFPPQDAIVGIAPRPNARGAANVLEVPFHAYDEGDFYRLAFGNIVEHPWRLVRDLGNVVDGFGLGSIGYYPGLMGRNDWLLAPGRILFGMAVLPACVHAVLLLRRRPFSLAHHAPRMLLWGILLSMTLTLYLFLGDPRIRVPFDPLWIVLGADAWGDAIASVRRRMRDREAPAQASNR